MENNKKHKKRQSRCIFPNYKWCGSGCSGPGEPINDVDACCRIHDLCLRQGISPCRCDFEFMNCLRPKINHQTQKGIIASLMYLAFKLKTCFTCNRF